MIKFYYNGLKVNGGKLEKFMAWERQAYKTSPAGIAIHARDYTRFSPEVHKTFEVQNNTDSQTDYFEKDSFFVPVTHPRYAEIKRDVIDAKAAHFDKKNAKKSSNLKALFEKAPKPAVTISNEALDKIADLHAKAKDADLKSKGFEVAALFIKKYGLNKIAAQEPEVTERTFADLYE